MPAAGALTLEWGRSSSATRRATRRYQRRMRTGQRRNTELRYYYPHCTLLSARRAVCLFTTFPGRGITVMVNLWELVRDGRYCPRDKDVFRRVPAGAARVRRHISDLELTCLCICYVSVL
jgi:hypothetical protein